MVPTRVIALNDFGMRDKGMTAIQLIWLMLTILIIGNFAGKSLQGGSRKKHQQLSHVRTTARRAEHLLNLLEKAMKKIQADDLLIVRGNGITKPQIGRSIGATYRLNNIKLTVDGHAHRHIVHRFSRPDQA